MSCLSFSLYSIDTHFDASTTDRFGIHCGKRRNCSLRAISPFPKMFVLNQIIVSPFAHIFGIIYLFAAQLEDPKIGTSGKGLTLYQTTF